MIKDVVIHKGLLRIAARTFVCMVGNSERGLRGGRGLTVSIPVEKSLALYRERPGGKRLQGGRRSGRDVRDTAICSKPSTKPMGIEWLSPPWSVRGKVVLADLCCMDQ